MTKAECILQDLEDMGVDVFYCPFSSLDAISSPDKYLGYNPRGKTGAELATILAHEAGHFLTGKFYYCSAPVEIITRAESSATRAALIRYVPYEVLTRCFHSGINTIWELAEYFEVTEEAILQACNFYKNVMGYDFSER